MPPSSAPSCRFKAASLRYDLHIRWEILISKKSKVHLSIFVDLNSLAKRVRSDQPKRYFKQSITKKEMDYEQARLDGSSR